jgi:hypothetical protein
LHEKPHPSDDPQATGPRRFPLYGVCDVSSGNGKARWNTLAQFVVLLDERCSIVDVDKRERVSTPCRQKCYVLCECSRNLCKAACYRRVWQKLENAPGGAEGNMRIVAPSNAKKARLDRTDIQHNASAGLQENECLDDTFQGTDAVSRLKDARKMQLPP